MEVNDIVIEDARSSDVISRFALKPESDQPLVLRSYQNELAEAGLAGENSIVCAPTGSGKTHVAVAVIEDNLRKNENGKVVFFVPTVDLVKQQCDVVTQYLGHRYRIKAIAGGSTAQANIPKREFLERFQIIVLTPAIFLNALCDEDAERPVKFEDFSLLVFDECHHTDKGHPYNEIMVKYLDKKIENKVEGKLPLILGMTASLGTGKANGPADAHMFAMNVCARMDAQQLCTVERCADDLESFVNVPRDELTSVPSVRSHTFTGIIQSLMIAIEKPLTEDLSQALEGSTVDLNLNPNPPSDKIGPAYTTFVHANKRHLPVLDDAELKRRCITRLEHLEVYHNTLDVVSHVPANFAFAYLDEAMAEKRQKVSTDLCTKLLDHYDQCREVLKGVANDPAGRHVPLASKLEEILVSEYRDRPESRTLVFVRTREITKALVAFIEAEPATRALCPGRLVGSGVSSLKGGQQSSVQRDTLAKFRTGEHKVLVATTVAEEGLDIQMCNLVIKYNHVTNEIAMIQKRGRGRSEGSRSILLVQEAKLAEKEMTNMVREALMREALKRIRSDTKEKYKLVVASMQQIEYQRREISRKQREHQRSLLGNAEFLLKCKKCDALCCSSNEVRRAQETHYLCTDPQIWRRAKVWSLGEKIDIFEYLTIAGRLACAECNSEWGIVVKYRDAYMPGLKCDSFVFEKLGATGRKDARQTRKKWKQVVQQMFTVDGVETKDILAMIKAERAPVEMLDAAVERWKRAKIAENRKKELANSATGHLVNAGAGAGDNASNVPVGSLIDI